ncbi:hypothetical protein Dimus_039549 [Dionaea muscipula]
MEDLSSCLVWCAKAIHTRGKQKVREENKRKEEKRRKVRFLLTLDLILIRFMFPCINGAEDSFVPCLLLHLAGYIKIKTKGKELRKEAKGEGGRRKEKLEVFGDFPSFPHLELGMSLIFG